MELSIFVAKVIALIYLPLGIALLAGQLKGKELVASFEKSLGLSLVIGCFGMIIGVFLITYHNVWVKDWPVLITIVGWMAVIESAFLLALPKFSFSMTKVIPKNEKLWGIITLILGLIFGYFGFIA
jgi:hypothetical protein